MRTYFTIGILLIVTLITGLLGYGVYLNQRGETQITERMEDLRLPLRGTRVQVRDIIPRVEMELVSLYTDEMADVTALGNGRIRQQFVEKNSYVQAGTPIIYLEDETLALKLRQADSDILEAEAQLMKAQNSYGRYRELVELDAVSKERFDEAEANYKATLAKLENIQAQREQIILQESRQTVLSPIEGEVLMLYQKPGTYVSAGAPLALVGNFGRLRFTVPVEDKYASRMVPGREMDISFYGSEAVQKSYGAEYGRGNMGENQIFTAVVVKVSPDLSQPAALRQVVWEIDNSMGLLEPGVYSKARLLSRRRHHALVVPLTALADKQSNQVSALSPEGTLELVEVETGMTDGEYIEIVAGLSEGQVVITSDTEGLKEGTPVEVTLEGDE